MHRFLRVAFLFAAVSGGSRRAHALPPDALPARTPLVERAPSSRGAGDPFAPTISVKTHYGTKVGSCLGVMIAPRIGLTAGHCVSTSAKIIVHAATVGGSKKTVLVHRYWTDPTSDHRRGLVDMDASDIAILVLAEPLPMPAYARYARSPIDQSVDATGIRNAANVLEAMPITLRPAANVRYYASNGFAAPGDSGSPVFVGEGDERIVVGVLAGGSPGREVFARVDMVAHKLDELVRATSAGVASPSRPPAQMPPLIAPLPSRPAAPKPPVPAPTPNVTWT